MRILIFRSGAYGDALITTPVIRYLKAQGHELIYVTSKRGMEVLKNNPHIERLIQHKEETKIEDLASNIEGLRKKFKCEKVIDFSESIEVALSQHPRSPNYKLPKLERITKFNRNFYEYAFEHANLSDEVTINGTLPISSHFYRPELFFDKRELYDVRDEGRHEAVDYIDEFKFNILLGMSGSGGNKAWPWMETLALQICEKYSDVHIITVGDEKCRLIEPELEGHITNLSGKIPMRMSMEMTGLVQLVIAPDTGIIHAAGCYDTPKICLLGHNTIETITKHFVNDLSVEANTDLAPCSPCLSLIYNKDQQCPTVAEYGGSVLCMAKGISLQRVMEQFEKIYAEFKKRS